MRARRFTAALLLVGLVAACGYEPTSPDDDESQALPLQLSIVGPQAVSQAETDALGAAFDRVDEYSVRIVDAVTEELLVDTIIAIPANSAIHDLDITVPDEALGRTVTITLIAFDDGVELYRSVQTATLSEDLNDQVDVDVEIRYTGPGVRGLIVDDQGAPAGGATVNLWSGQTIVDAVVTEDDGTYLFLDVTPGSYAIVPIGTQGLNVCPGSRDIALSTSEDALIANFRMEDGCQTDVLVLSGGDFDDTQAAADAINMDSELNATTFFHVNQLPGVDFLSQFDVVLVFMNGLFDESAQLGDQLYQYVEGGGNVVTASFYYQGRSDSNLGSVGWGMLEQIDPFTARLSQTTNEGGATYQPVTLAPGVDQSHPMTSQLSTLSSTSFSSGVTAKIDTQVLASWSDGSPLVGYRIGPAGQRLVGVSLFPVPDPTISGDVDLLWTSVLRWAGFGPPPQI